MPDSHSAAGSAAGYQFQADYCLYALLVDGGPGRSISLELHDDVAWDQDGTPLEKLQIKHTVKGAGGLGDKSDSMWRTIKAWIDAGAPSDSDGPALTLVTSGSAGAGSAAHHLKPGADRDAAKAADLLRKAAKESTNTDATLKAAREKFRNLSVPAQNAFIARITVLDKQPTIIDIEQAVHDRIWTHLPQDETKKADFLNMLWGWWRARVVEMLSKRYFPNNASLRETVSSSDLHAQLNRLTVDFSERGLPEFVELDIDYTEEAMGGLADEVFVHQLNFVRAHESVIVRAIVDFYRATHSEVKWLERDFLRTDEIQRYERKLKEAWNLAFGFMLSDLPGSATATDQEAAGRRLLQALLAETKHRIRDRVDQDFYYRGKHHMLAQDATVGWHPNFKAQVSSLLLGAGAAP